MLTRFVLAPPLPLIARLGFDDRFLDFFNDSLRALLARFYSVYLLRLACSRVWTPKLNQVAAELPSCWVFGVQLGLACVLAYFFARLSLHHLLCVAHTLMFNKILQGNYHIKLLDTKKALLDGVLNQCSENLKSKYRTHRRLVAKPNILRNCPMTNHKFTWKKSIDTYLTLSFTDSKNEVEHDFSEGLSSRVFLKFGRRLPNLTKLLFPQEFRLGGARTLYNKYRGWTLTY